MRSTPHLDALRDAVREHPEARVASSQRDAANGMHYIYMVDLLREVGALEKDLRELAAQAAMITTVRPSGKKLREVQLEPYGWLYRWNNNQLEVKVNESAKWKVREFIPVGILDAVNALRADPYEPVETVEDVLGRALDRAYYAGEKRVHGWEGTDTLTRTTAEQVRLAVVHETGGAT